MACTTADSFVVSFLTVIKKAPPVQQLIQDLWSMWISSCSKTEYVRNQEAESEYKEIEEGIAPHSAQWTINHLLLWEPCHQRSRSFSNLVSHFQSYV